MANSSGERLRVISDSFVRPEHEVEAAKQPYYLGPVDITMLSLHPIQKGLRFALENGEQNIKIKHLVEKLKRALSIALVHFYPLAGRFETIKYEDEHKCSIYIDCNKGPGARLIHASCDDDVSVSDILSSVDVHPSVRSFFDLGERIVNYDGHTKTLLSIQVTEISGGVFLGFTMNHSVVDGTTFTHVVSTLSEIVCSQDQRGEDSGRISREPLYKMYAPDGYGPVFKLPYLEPEEFITQHDPGPLRERIFHFSPESMARLKAKANEENSEPQDISISSFIALSGLVWRSIVRAQNPPPNEKTYCGVLVNARTRLDPPLSDNYFGNFLDQARQLRDVKEVMGQNMGWAAKLLSQAVKNKSKKDIDELLIWLCENLLVAKLGWEGQYFGAVCPVVIGGSHRFDLYGPEFGLGRAVAVRMGYPNKEHGKVTANPGREGRGSVDLEICLRPQVMRALEADEEFMSFVSM